MLKLIPVTQLSLQQQERENRHSRKEEPHMHTQKCNCAQSYLVVSVKIRIACI